MRLDPTNLREAPAPFVGRAQDLAAIDELFTRGERLVTLTGPGGIGKTRLAIRFAASQGAAYGGRGGVWFCDLTEATTLTEMASLVADVLHTRLPAGVTDARAASDLAPALAHRGRMLLVLDNFEHLVELAAPAIDLWLEKAPQLHILVTSRIALGRPGEHRWPVSELREAEGVDLFVRRAQQVRPGLKPNGEDLAVVSAIVRQLEGMPLAIELAASHMTAMSPAQLHARLARPLDLLVAAGNDGRHTSVRRTVLDSVRLLGAADRDAFVACAVFRRGFSLEAAEGVIGARDPLASIETLVRHSLLRASAGVDGELRFSFFEVVREVASDFFAEAPARDAIAARHEAFFAELARALGPDAEVRPAGSAAQRLGLDLENFLAAHTSATKGGGAERALAIALALDPVLAARGLSQLRLRLLDEALAAGDGETFAGDAALPIGALLARGLALRELGAMEAARAAVDDGLARAESLDLPALQALAHARIGDIVEIAGRTAEAHARFQRALALLASSPPGPLRVLREAEVLVRDGHAHRREGSLAHAEVAITEAIVRYRQLGHEEGLAAAIYEAAVVALFQGRLEAALARFDEGLALARSADLRPALGALTTARGSLLQELGRLGEAALHHADAARIFRELGSQYRETSALYYLATAYLEKGDLADAERVLSLALERTRAVGSPRYTALIEGCRAVLSAERGDLAAARDALAAAQAMAAACTTEGALVATIAIHAMTVDVRAGLGLAEPESRSRALVESHPSDDSRFAARVLRVALGPSRERVRRVLVVWNAGEAFVPPGGGEGVDLSSRAPLKRILGLLADRRSSAPGEGVPIEDIVRAGWPDERMQSRAALNRAYVALATLRKLGLREVIVRGPGGYWLHPAVAMEKGSITSRKPSS